MSTNPPSRFALGLTWFVVILSAVLLTWGIVNYGLSINVDRNFWHHIFGRLSGPMTFRLILQPTMAFLAALPDGISDARRGRHRFFWAAWGHPDVKTGRLREGTVSTARIVLLGISMDAIYQFRVYDRFFPIEALLMAVLLAVVPYFLFREIIGRVARWSSARKGR